MSGLRDDQTRIRRDGLGLTGVEVTEDGLYCDYGRGKTFEPVGKCPTCGEDVWDDKGDECFDCEERRAEREHIRHLEDIGHWGRDEQIDKPPPEVG